MDVQDTIDYYDREARHYATLISPEPPRWLGAGLERFAELVVPGSPVLEIGSGTGRDADWLEGRGVQIHRTDVAPGFVALQAERGRTVHTLDVVSDDLGGPYGGVLAVAVLMHVPRAELAGVLRRITAALLPGGPLFVCTREGEGDEPPPAEMAFYGRDEFVAHLVEAGLTPEWDDVHAGEDESWITVAATRPEG